MAKQVDVKALLERMPIVVRGRYYGEATPPKHKPRKQKGPKIGDGDDSLKLRDPNAPKPQPKPTEKPKGPVEQIAPGIFDQMLEGGPDAIRQIVSMITEVDDGADYPARYMLHGLATYVCRPDKQDQQQMLVEALVSQLGGSCPTEVQKVVLQQLRVAGGKDAAAKVGALLNDEQLCDRAALALTAIKDGAVEPFRAALPKAKGRCRLVIVQALGVLEDKASVAALSKAAGDADAQVRMAAVWGLANIGDAGAIGPVIKATDAPDGSWERVKANKACLLLAEKLAVAGDKSGAKKVYTHLRDSRTDESEQYVKEAAEAGLASAGA